MRGAAPALVGAPVLAALSAARVPSAGVRPARRRRSPGDLQDGGRPVGTGVGDLLGGRRLDDGLIDRTGFDHARGGRHDGHLRGGALAREEGAELHRGLVAEHTADDLDLVVEAGVAQDIAHGARGPGLGVPGAEDDAVDAGGHDRPRAHGAGLQGDDQRATDQVPALEGAGGVAQGDDLGVPSGVAVLLAAVPALADDPAQRVEHDGPDGHVAGFTGAVRQVEGLAHGLTVAVSQCHMS